MTAYKVVNPATGQTESEFPEATDVEIQDVLDRSADAYRTWRASDVKDRVAVLERVAELYAERKDELASLITREMGKPVTQARGEIDITVSIYRYYAENGPGFLADEELDVVAGGSAVVRKEGIGPLLGIMPWNFPYYQVARFAAPNLMLGNTILLKHAPQCPESALAMEKIFRDAGLPDGAYINLFASNEQVSTIIADPRVQGISLTGSERAGAAVAEQAGRHLKKVVLELGGSDPFLVLRPADLDRTVKNAFFGRYGNAGQACNAAKRIIVLADQYEEFTRKFAETVQGVTPGDPTEDGTFMGPLSSRQAVENLAAQIEDAVANGATLLAGGKPLDREGAWFEPTVLTNVGPGMRAFQEELFGPAAVIYKVETEDEAVALANNTPYGLGAAIATDDPERALRVAAQLDTGMVYVNEAGGTAAELPFGGVKRSGIGRELGKYGMEEFANKKLVRVRR
ncbi:NAD-dependent succinate-semialdehyde dehydrogenase [Streptomyces sp. DSM 41982]|uniref:NAD-dependent succinate-semialdehyde dehydrogenase n=1 Tax=Streptomyces evansiae TaxID=3075535 RepID=A0ABD5E617_9ACTN|nr:MULTISPECIES: NAD-dependent succinate-semialdehyde dehydrogenase [unclassified Streptomyces]MDT0416875.1 NAD-dependent succinate-semialdehyde dehydrogenase [Streptomyces sp. DSM 41982]SCE16413.1 succinate-semialdehyde dehydrogenase / glutarate-semialdehyde dehydrogenase [Streptomyces sp. SolWspMP-sol7th]